MDYVRKQTEQLVNDDLFDPELINELINIHETYHFVPFDQQRRQLLFFLRFITELMKHRQDWQYDELVERFVSNLDKTSMSLKPFVLLLRMGID